MDLATAVFELQNFEQANDPTSERSEVRVTKWEDYAFFALPKLEVHRGIGFGPLSPRFLKNSKFLDLFVSTFGF